MWNYTGYSFIFLLRIQMTVSWLEEMHGKLKNIIASSLEKIFSIMFNVIPRYTKCTHILLSTIFTCPLLRASSKSPMWMRPPRPTFIILTPFLHVLNTAALIISIKCNIQLLVKYSLLISPQRTEQFYECDLIELVKF